MSHAEINYEQKFVAFVDILGFKGLVEKSADEDRPQDIARMIKRLGSDQKAYSVVPGSRVSAAAVGAAPS